MNATNAGHARSVPNAAKARGAALVSDETRMWVEAVIAGRIAMGLPRVTATIPGMTDADIDSMLDAAPIS